MQRSCDPTYTDGLGTQVLNVFSVILHMHHFGSTITLNQMKGTENLGPMARTNQRDFNNQKFYPVNRTIIAGGKNKQTNKQI